MKIPKFFKYFLKIPKNSKRFFENSEIFQTIVIFENSENSNNNYGRQQNGFNRPMDAAEVDRLRREAHEQEERKRWNRQSSAVKLQLPRPDTAMVANVWAQDESAPTSSSLWVVAQAGGRIG